MKKRTHLYHTLASALLVLPVISSAQLTLNVDTLNETLSFTGSDSVAPLDLSGNGYLQWQLSAIPTLADGTSGIDQATGITMFTSSNSTPIVFASSDTLLATNSGGNRRLAIWMAFDSPNATTITGNGTAVSYAGWDAGAKEILETAIGSSFPGLSAFGSSDMAIVPEPSTAMYFTILGVTATGLAAISRRRRSRK